MPQLQINQGPQDALLYDNSRSYFTNVGYVRTSNFQQEFRDVDPQNTANLGSTMQFVIPKAADLLGAVDLCIQFNKTDFSAAGTTMAGSIGSGQSAWAGWVESLGCAIIDKVVFSVGSHDIETISGDQLYITNELMRGDEHRFGKKLILKTGRPLVRADCGSGNLWNPIYDTSTDHNNSSRLICGQIDGSGAGDDADTFYNYDGKHLTIPLGLFFTKHPSQYFPLAAVAGCNDVRISVKLRTFNELVVLKTSQNVVSGSVDDSSTANQTVTTLPNPGIETGKCKLRCHYYHLTGPEASTLMNKEHVRLLKAWQNHNVTTTLAAGPSTNKTKLFDFELPFLHPIQELIIVIRKTSEMTSSTDVSAKESEYDQKARAKNYFAFQGGGKDPNIESQRNCVHEVASDAVEAYLTVDNFKLTLNGVERHPSLASTGLDRDYLMNRLMPMLHSNTSTNFTDTTDGVYFDGMPHSQVHNYYDFKALSEMIDRKEIYVFPFALNPEGSNPSGAVNFSKVSHAKLSIEGTSYATGNVSGGVEYRCDVWGVNFNWLQIKDGRALTSFA